jgi:hypothetical protein
MGRGEKYFQIAFERSTQLTLFFSIEDDERVWSGLGLDILLVFPALPRVSLEFGQRET